MADITCEAPPLSCSTSSHLFTEPTLELTATDFFMNTYVKTNCGPIDRVVLRFNSYDGDIDYELVPRGQNFYALRKGINEISNFTLFTEGVFHAYDRYGNVVGQRWVQMKKK